MVNAMSCGIKKLLAIAFLGLTVLLVEQASWTSFVFDAVSAATSPPGPGSTPSVVVSSSNPTINNNIQQMGPSGGLSTIRLTLKDPIAQGYPNSLKLGVVESGRCVYSGGGLPAGATFSSQIISDTQVDGVFTWNVPEGSPATTVNFCGVNTGWDTQATRQVTIMATGLVKTINLKSASYNAKKRVLQIKGSAVPNLARTSLKGSTLTIENADSGASIEATVLKGNAFVLSIKNAAPVSKVLALVAGVRSSPVTVKGGEVTNEVVSINDAPKLLTANPGKEYQFQFSATDSKSQPLTFTLDSNVPNGMTISPDGLLKWTPTDKNSGLECFYSYTVSATSSTGAVAKKTLGVGVCNEGTGWMSGMAGSCTNAGHCM